MTNVYRYRRRRDPLAKLYVPALLLLGLAGWRQIETHMTPEAPAAKPSKPAPYIRLQSRSEREYGDDAPRRQTGSTSFRNCTEARAAGYEDIPSSNSRYGDHLDADNDGLACEPPPRSRR